jgi:hypothetical protein
MDGRIPNADASLYHLTTDPDEQNNLAKDPAFDEILKRLEEMAHRWDRET